MNRSAKYVAKTAWTLMAALCALVAAPAAAQGADTAQQTILREIAAGHNAAALIKQYRAGQGAGGASPRIDRGAAVRQLDSAARALGAALQPLQSPSGVTAAALQQAGAAYQDWLAAALVLEARQQAITEQLRDSDAGADYLARHQQVVQQLAARRQQVRQLLDASLGGASASAAGAATPTPTAVVAAPSAADTAAAAKAAAALLAPPRAQPAREPILHAAGLPVGGLNLATRAPRLTPLVVPSYATASETAAQAADTAAAPEAPLSDEIMAQAKALDNDYVRIYESVRNGARTEWYAGSVKGAAGTLRSGAGNDVDQASLLISLLRAAGVPARYVRGVIELPVEQVASKLGLADTSLAPTALTKAGIAFSPVVRGGKVALLQFEHTWVAALVPYTNYRGAVVDASGKTWIPLDPSYKDYAWSAATLALADIATPAVLQADYLAQTRGVSFADYLKKRATDLLQARDGAAAADYAAQLGKQTITPLNLSVLPNSLPYTVVAVTAEEAVLADSELVRAHVALSNGAAVVLDATLPLSDLVNQRFTLSYLPASLEDHRLTLSFGGLDSVPLYLIQLRPQLAVGGKVRAIGGAGVDPGSDLSLVIELSGPFGSQRVTQNVMAGAYQAVALGGTAATRPAAADPADAEAEAARLLDGVALAYQRNWMDGEAQLAALTGVRLLRPAPSVAIVSNQMDTLFIDGVPSTLVWKGVTLDAALHPVEPVGANGKDFLALSGLHGSSLEATLFQDQFAVDAISADQGLALARSQGVAVLSLDAGNLAALDATDHAAAVKAHIANLVRLGYRVDVPAQRLAQHAWTGSVWRATEAASGASGYFISGALAGGATTTAPDAWTLDFLADMLAMPNTDAYNKDPMAGVALQKIGVGDGQTGVVGSVLGKPLTVVVLDKAGAPVQGAKVHFQVTAGGGKVAGGASYDTTTNALGMASADATLGESTASNALYVNLKPSDPQPTQVGLNLIDVTADSDRGALRADTPFSAIGTPGPIAGLRRTTPEVTQGPASLWVDAISIAAEDKFANPLPNVELTFAISSEPVCPSDGAATYFKPGAVFDNTLGPNGAMLGCSVHTPQLGDCGGPSFSSKTGTLGTASAAVLLGNDVMGRNTLRVSGAGLQKSFLYTASGSCSATGQNYSANYYATLSSEGTTLDGNGNNISAAKPGQLYAKSLNASVSRTEWPYEVRTVNGQPVIYYFPYVKNVKSDGTVAFSVAGGGAASAALRAGLGEYSSTVTVGGTPGPNDVTGNASAIRVEIPKLVNGVLTLEQQYLDVSGKVATIYAVRPKVDQLVAGDSPFIVLDTNGHSVSQLELRYLIDPAAYKAALAEIDLYEGGSWIGSVSGDKQQVGGSALLARGQVFDIHKDYQAELVLNRGSQVELRSEKFTLPTQQKLIAYASGAAAALDVDLLNKRSCDIPGSISYGFSQDVLATLRLDTLDAGGAVTGTRELFSNKAYARGDYDYPVSAGEIGSGTFRFVLTAVDAGNAGHSELASGALVAIYKQTNQLPVGQVIVNGVKVRDGSLFAQGLSMQLPGRGPALRFQPTYASSANGSISSMGANWSHNFDSSLRINSCGEVVVSGGDAGSVRFFPNSDGSLRPDAGYHGTMLKNSSDGSFDFYSKDGTQYHYKFVDARVQWKLDTIVDPNGNSLTLGYDLAAKPEPRLLSVKSGDGRAFNFVYVERQLTSPIALGAKALLQQVSGPGLVMAFEYDTFGNLTAVDRNGRKEAYAYNVADADFRARGLMTSSTDANGNVTAYEYNKLEITATPQGSGTLIVLPHSMVTAIHTPGGNIGYEFDVPGFKNSKVTDQDGNVTSYTLNELGSPLTITDAAGTTTMSWDTQDVAMLSKRDARGVTTTYRYDTAGNQVQESTAGVSLSSTYLLQAAAPFAKNRVASHTDRNGNLSTYAYDGKANLVMETLPEGVVRRHGYAGNGDRLSTIDGNGGTSRYGYDDAGNLVRSVDPLGAVSGMTRNLRGQIVSSTDALGNITRMERDAQDQVTVQTDAENHATRYQYDGAGNKRQQTDAAGNQTSWSYDWHNLPLTIARADGSSKQIAYDGVGNKTSETDYRGNLTSYAYDGANRLIKRTEPLGKITAYGYDGVGNVLSETDGLGRVTRHEYNDLGYRTLTTDAADGVWSMGYDGNGNKTVSVDPLKRSTSYSYDGLNRLSGVVLPLGATSSYSYDKNGNKLSETDANGNQTRYVYDAGDRLTQLFDANGKQTVNEYDLNDNLTKSVDAMLNVTLYSYDALNRKKDMKDGEGYVTAYRYDEVGNLYTETQPNGNVVAHGYDKLNRLTSTSDTLGALASWDYDADGNKTAETDGNGHTTLHSYNALNQLTGSVMPAARTLGYENDVMGNRTSLTDGLLHVTRYEYDKLNRLTKTTDALAGVRSIDYDAVGNKVGNTDALNNKTVTAYDTLNRATTVTDALQQKVGFGYDLVGNKTSETDKRGTVSLMVYDKLDRLTSVTKDGVVLARNQYDDVGNLLAVTDANGNTVNYEYDKRKLRKAENRLLAAITRFQLDAMGDIKTSTDPEGRITTSSYDLRRHLTAQSNGAGETTRHSYDGAGNRTASVRPLGNRSDVSYDDANRVVQITDAAGTAEYGYDAADNRTAFKDALGNLTTFSYDALNRRSGVAYPGGAKESFGYDANGNLTSHVDGNGTVVGHGYDALNRETRKTYSASADGLQSIATEYDANNNVVKVTMAGTATQVSSYGYDHFDRQQQHTDPFGAKASTGYDANGNKTSLVTQDGKVTKYTYDVLNRLGGIVAQSGSVTYSYDRSSLNTRIAYSNGVTSDMSYDLATRVKTVAHAKGAVNVSRTEYLYDTNGNRSKESIVRTAGAQSTSYAYDGVDRLVQTSVVEAAQTVSTAYLLDAVGNRSKETVTTTPAGGAASSVVTSYGYDGRNALTSIADGAAGTTVLGYDQQGNLTRKTAGNDLTVYGYDARDNLISVTQNSTLLGSYRNDHLGLRIEKEAKDPLQPGAPPVRLRTLWDGRSAFQDSATDGAVVSRYETDGRHPVSLWSSTDGSQALHHDALGSIVATTDASGAIKSETIYDAYGNVQERTGASANKFGYTGHQMDQETGLIYFQARYYDPKIGRFITQDPFEGDYNTPASLHHYLYAYGNPTVYVDLYGYSAWDDVKNGGSRFVGAVAGAGLSIATGVADLGQLVHDNQMEHQYYLTGGLVGAQSHQNMQEFRAGVVHLVAHPIESAKAIGGQFKGDLDGAAREMDEGNHFTAGVVAGKMGMDIYGVVRMLPTLASGAAKTVQAVKTATAVRQAAKAEQLANLSAAEAKINAPRAPDQLSGDVPAKITEEGAGKELAAKDSPATAGTTVRPERHLPAPIEGDSDFVGPINKGSWRLTANGDGAHLVERANVRGRPDLAHFDKKETPRYYPNGSPEAAGKAHVRLHRATKAEGIKLKDNPDLTDDQLMDAYKRAYSRPEVQGIKGDVRTPNGQAIPGGEGVAPADAFDALRNHYEE